MQEDGTPRYYLPANYEPESPRIAKVRGVCPVSGSGSGSGTGATMGWGHPGSRFARRRIGSAQSPPNVEDA